MLGNDLFVPLNVTYSSSAPISLCSKHVIDLRCSIAVICISFLLSDISKRPPAELAALLRVPGAVGVRVWSIMSRCRGRTGEAIAARGPWPLPPFAYRCCITRSIKRPIIQMYHAIDAAHLWQQC